MAASLTASVKGTISHSHTNPLDLSTPVDALSMILTYAFASGTGINKANLVWSDLRSLGAGSSETIDVYDLAIDAGAAQTDALGLAFANLALKAIAIQIVDSAGALITTPVAGESLLFGGNEATSSLSTMFRVAGVASDSAQIVIAPAGCLILCTPSALGYKVTDDTAEGHIIKIVSLGAATIYYKIWILGATAGS